MDNCPGIRNGDERNRIDSTLISTCFAHKLYGQINTLIIFFGKAC